MESRYQVIIEKYAKEDIKSIFDYISNTLFNKGAAISFIQNIENKFASISLFPRSAPLINNEYIENKNIRKLCIDNYIAFYLIDEANKMVRIIRVISGLVNFIEVL